MADNGTEATHHVLDDRTASCAADAGGISATTLHDAVRIALDPQRAQDRSWRNWASCRTGGADNMYISGATRHGRHLLDRCRNDCAVQAECLAVALGTGERDGIWGGTTDAGRRRLRRALREAGLLGVVGEEAYVAWREYGTDREPRPPAPRPPIKDPWPHQDAAVTAIVGELRDGGVCQVSMATASGKTHVALWAAQALQAQRVLLLMPSLSLITQTAAVWAADDRTAKLPVLAVCSDTGDSNLESTTDPVRVREHVRASPGLVLSTYQSSQVLADAGVRFDLIVADEAHHLAGDADKAYAAVVRGEIPADRILYMTATPRRFTRRRSVESDVVTLSMDDNAAFGRRVFDFTLSDAIDAGVIADYRVIVAAVDRTTFDQVAAHPELVGVDAHLLAGAIAVVEAMGDQGLTSCVSFHTKVERARNFARLVGQVAELVPSIRPDGPGWSGYVHGGASVRIRERLLDRLADTGTWGVLANAKALGEGVDLPALDAVAIVDPKNSETDILQAAGRALRRSGTKVGTVLLPVLLSTDAVADDPMSGLDERSVSVVSGVLRALRAHDSGLGQRLDQTRRSLSRHNVTAPAHPDLAHALRQQAARGLLRSRVELHLPGGALGDLAGAMALHLVREATTTWEEAFARLQRWTEEHGHCRIPQSAAVTVTATATSSLGSWVSRQRSLHKRGLLAKERVRELEALPGWMWQARDEAWWEKFDALADFVATTGRYPRQMETHGDVRVGMFLWGCRAGYQDHENNWLTKFPDRCRALEALPGWTWAARDAAWEEHYEQLRRFANEHGHAMPGHEVSVDGFALGRWVTKERQKLRGGKRTADQASRLRALPGWVDSFHEVADQLWEDGFARLRAYTDEHGELPSQATRLADGYRLGPWLAKQREAHRGRRGSGALNEERQARLEALRGWTWDPYGDAWERHLQALARIAPQRLGADGYVIVPQGRVGDLDLSSWATAQRMAYSRGRLTADRIAALEAVTGWTWDAGRGRRVAATA